jgi:hypothetical protein
MKFTPATIFAAIGSEPTQKKVIQLAAMMMRENGSEIYNNNIKTLKYYMDVVSVGYNTGAFCNCFKPAQATK